MQKLQVSGRIPHYHYHYHLPLLLGLVKDIINKAVIWFGKYTSKQQLATSSQQSAGDFLILKKKKHYVK